MPLDYVLHCLYLPLKQYFLPVKSKLGQVLWNNQMNSQIPSHDLKLVTNLLVRLFLKSQFYMPMQKIK